MLSVALAQDQVMSALESVRARLAVESVPLSSARGRSLASDVLAPIDVPPWSNSAMDGYAVRADEATAGARLPVAGVVYAGDAWDGPVPRGAAVRIMTGAPIPEGMDTVVMQENTHAADGMVTFVSGARRGRNIRQQAQDMATGSLVLKAGTPIDAIKLGLLASLGLTHIPCVARPKVSVIATGDELVAAGQPLSPGMIYESNGLMLAGLCEEVGCVVSQKKVADDKRLIRQAFEQALATSDVVLSIGGASVGDKDFIKPVLTELGIELAFSKVRMKPGKPIAFGCHQQVAMFGLPGNPTSAAMGFYQFVRPFLLGMMRSSTPFFQLVPARLRGEVNERAGRARFIRVRAWLEAGQLWVAQQGISSSGALMGLAHADGLLYVPADADMPSDGQPVMVQLLRAPQSQTSGC